MSTAFESLDADWLSLDEAVARVLGHGRPLAAEIVPLEDALGRTLASELQARVTLPPFDNSAMDGYAVRGDDVRGADPDAPVTLPVTGAVRAGEPRRPAVEPGHAVRIMTGAPLPPGADTVIRVEHTDAEEGEAGRVVVSSDRDLGRHIRPRGQDFSQGDVVVLRGTLLTPGWAAVAAAAGHAEVPVHRRPRVAVLACGDELRKAGSPAALEDVAGGWAIPDSNSPMLAAAIRAAGCEPMMLGIARDDPGDIRARVRHALDADGLVTIGGASMGEADLLKRTLLEDGLELDFWRVRIRPGSPFSLGFLPREEPLPVFGLPGNPASAFVTFQILVRPFLRRLAGHPAPFRRVVTARAGEHLPSTPRLCHFHRVTLDDGAGAPLVARLTGAQGSGLVGSLGPAAGLAVVPEGAAGVEEGEEVGVILLDDEAPGRSDPGYRAGPGAAG